MPRYKKSGQLTVVCDKVGIAEKASGGYLS